MSCPSAQVRSFPTLVGQVPRLTPDQSRNFAPPLASVIPCALGGSWDLATQLPILTTVTSGTVERRTLQVWTSRSTMMAVVSGVPFIHCDEPASGRT
jgi:hypothetical protein